MKILKGWLQKSLNICNVAPPLAPPSGGELINQYPLYTSQQTQHLVTFASVEPPLGENKLSSPKGEDVQRTGGVLFLNKKGRISCLFLIILLINLLISFYRKDLLNLLQIHLMSLDCFHIRIHI